MELSFNCPTELEVLFGLFFEPLIFAQIPLSHAHQCIEMGESFNPLPTYQIKVSI